MRIVSDPDFVLPLSSELQNLADIERQSFGFLPKAAYEQAASQGKVYVCLVGEREEEQVAGYLFSGGTFPHARIFQLFVSPEFRRQKIGKQLLDKFSQSCVDRDFLSISVRVASDLSVADKFWKRMGFRLVKSTHGGKSRNRIINVRVKDLDTPSLLSLMQESAPKSVADLQLSDLLEKGPPLYVIDLNVLLDVANARPRSGAAGTILRAGLQSTIRVAVTAEFMNELSRNSARYTEDQLMQIASNFPALQEPPTQAKKKYFNEIANLLFPNKAREGNLSVRDNSDVSHIVSAIYHNADGFVTSEKRILKTRDTVRQNYGIDLLGVEELAALTNLDDTSQMHDVLARASNSLIHTFEPQDIDLPAIEEFLASLQVDQITRRDLLSGHRARTQRNRIVVTRDDQIVGFGSWDSPSDIQPDNNIFLCVDEDDPGSQNIADHLFHHIGEQLTKSGPRSININLLPGHTFTRRVALSHGYRPPSGHQQNTNRLRKFGVGRIVSERNWAEFRTTAKKVAGVTFSTTYPDISSENSQISLTTPTGKSVKIPLFELETLISPVLFLFSWRKGVIIPIRAPYAYDLFGTSSQTSLLETQEALLMRKRAYVGKRGNINVLQKGTPILFYESLKGDGRGAVIAAARVTKNELVLKSDISNVAGDRVVVDEVNLSQLANSEKRTVTSFDNIFSLDNPVPLKRLRELGCADGANFVTAKEVSGRCIKDILGEGFSHGKH